MSDDTLSPIGGGERRLLALVEEFAQRSPVEFDSLEDPRCFFCFSSRTTTGGDRTILHEDDCLWKRANALSDELST